MVELHKIGLDNTPFISVIIPAYNEAEYIPYCLESLNNLNYPKEYNEIIVVDNGSTDVTVRIAKKYTPKVYICPNITISALRNYGAKKAAGDIYAFIDADCIADKDWLQNAIASIKKDSCVTGSKCRIPDNATWIEKAWFSQGPKGRREVAYINSGNMIVPTAIFKRVGGFNELLKTGEDYEFCLRARDETKIISDDAIVVTHLANPKTLGQFLKREIWHGLGAFGSLKTRLIDKPLIGTFIFFWLTLLQIYGLAYSLIIVKSGTLFFYSSMGIVLLLAMTVIYRTKFAPIKFSQKIQLFLLYYLFYLGRSISLLYLIRGRTFRRIK